MHHDEFISRTVDNVRNVDTAVLARAWMHSLETRDHSLRSAWGSVVLLRHLPKHPFEPSTLFHPSGCAVCGVGVEVKIVPEERLAESRYRYLVATVDWAAADVEGAERRIRAAQLPAESNRGILENILSAIANLGPDAQLTQLNAALIGQLKADKYERMRLLEQLGCAGILPAGDHPNYATEWVRWEDANSRQPRERNKREWAYPVRFWSGSDGVNWQAADDAFGHEFESIQKLEQTR